MTYYTDLTREIAMLCLSMSLGGAEGFVDDVEADKLTKTEYIAVLAASATRIGGCANYDPAAAFATASRLTERALATYDPKSGDQTLDLMKLLTNYMRYPESSFTHDDPVSAQLELYEVWISVWIKAEGQLDPNWAPGQAFPPFEGPGVIDGQTPDGIADPAVKAAYEEHLARKAQFLAYQRDQMLLRRALEQYEASYIDYANHLRSLDGTQEALAAFAKEINASNLQAALVG